MDRLTVHAASPESGHAMLAALAGFRAELFHSADGCEVDVTLNGAEGEITGVLTALEQFLTTRASGHTEVELNGHTYVMGPQ